MVADYVVQFLDEFYPSSSDCDMDFIVKRYVKWLLIESDAYSFPVDVSKIVNRFQIPIQKEHFMNQNGFIIEGSTNIFLNASDSNGRQMFSFGHELVEKLFEAMKVVDIPTLSDVELIKLFEVSAAEKERLCDYGAAEFLMPMELFYPYVCFHGFSLKTAIKIQQDSGISLEAILRRMVEANIKSAAFVIWHFEYKTAKIKQHVLPFDAEFVPYKKLRVKSVYPSPNFANFIPKDKSIDESSVIGEAFNNEYKSISKRLEMIHKHEYEVEATPVFLEQNKGVYSLLYQIGKDK